MPGMPLEGHSEDLLGDLSDLLLAIFLVDGLEAFLALGGNS